MGFGPGLFRPGPLPGAAADVLVAMAKKNPQLYLQDPELLYYIGEAEFQLGNYEKAPVLLPVGPEYQAGHARRRHHHDPCGRQLRLPGPLSGGQGNLRPGPGCLPGHRRRVGLAHTPGRVPGKRHRTPPGTSSRSRPTWTPTATYKEIADKYTNREVGQLAKVKLSVYFYKKKRYAKSIDILEKLLQLHPNTPFRGEVDYTLNLAVIGYLEKLKADGKPLELMDAYLRNRVLLKRPNSNEMLKLLAWAYGQANLYDRAAGLYRVLAGRGVVDPAIWLAWSENLYKNGDYGEAAETLAETDFAAISGPEAVTAKSLYGKALQRTGDYKKSAEVLTGLLKKSPSHPGAAGDYRALGLSLVQLGQYNEALAAFDRSAAILEQQTSQDALLERFMVAMDSGLAARRAGNKSLSIMQYATAEGLAQSGDDKAQARYELAKAYHRAGKTKQMVTVLKDLVEMEKIPWSDMAKGMLDDLALTKRLVEIGK